MKKMILTAFAAAAVAVGAQAQQVVSAQAGEQLTISSVEDANAGGAITYQWFRNGTAIAGANGTTYTIPAAQANGMNVTYHRRAIVDGCAVGNTANSNYIVINFYNVVVNGVRWADVNATGNRTFAERPDMYTDFYQFNRTTAWPATGVAVGVWPTPIDENSNWDEAEGTGNPVCPAGWRLPTGAEQIALHLGSNPIGGVFAEAGTRGNAVRGKFFGPNATTCTVGGDMAGCIFLPMNGYRVTGNGFANINGQGVHTLYWSSSQANNAYAATLYFHTGGAAPSPYYHPKDNGMPIRCVQ